MQLVLPKVNFNLDFVLDLDFDYGSPPTEKEREQAYQRKDSLIVPEMNLKNEGKKDTYGTNAIWSNRNGPY